MTMGMSIRKNQVREGAGVSDYKGKHMFHVPGNLGALKCSKGTIMRKCWLFFSRHSQGVWGR